MTKKFDIEEVLDVYHFSFLANAASPSDVLRHVGKSMGGFKRSLRSKAGKDAGRLGVVTAQEILSCLANTTLKYLQSSSHTTTYRRSRMNLYKDIADVLVFETLSKRKLKQRGLARQHELLVRGCRHAYDMRLAA